MTTKSENYLSWSYYKGKYDEIEALETYFPETLAENMQLRLAVAQIKNAKLVIGSIMGTLEEQAQND